MRFVVGIGKHMWIWETGVSHATIQASSAQAVAEEGFVDRDPHGTVSCHAEISPHAVGAYAKQRMGFHGSEVPARGEAV